MIKGFLFVFIFLSLGINKCENKPMHDFKTLCVIDREEFMCWRSKEDNVGFSIDQMDSWLAISDEEFELIMDSLLECKFNRNN